MAFHQQGEVGLGAANGFNGVGGFIAPGVIPGPQGNYPRGEVYGEDTRVCYNIENPSIDLEAYALGYTGLAAIYRLRFIAHHCPMLKVSFWPLTALQRTTFRHRSGKGRRGSYVNFSQF